MGLDPEPGRVARDLRDRRRLAPAPRHRQSVTQRPSHALMRRSLLSVELPPPMPVAVSQLARAKAAPLLAVEHAQTQGAFGQFQYPTSPSPMSGRPRSWPATSRWPTWNGFLNGPDVGAYVPAPVHRSVAQAQLDQPGDPDQGDSLHERVSQPVPGQHRDPALASGQLSAPRARRASRAREDQAAPRGRPRA